MDCEPKTYILENNTNTLKIRRHLIGNNGNTLKIRRNPIEVLLTSYEIQLDLH